MTTTDTVAGQSLADRARAERDRIRAQEIEAAERQVAERRERLIRDATDAFKLRFGRDATDLEWHILPRSEDPTEDPAADTTVDGLRFRFRDDGRDGVLYLLVDCEVCRADVRRATIDSPRRFWGFNPLQQLADLLDPIDSPEAAQPWWCSTCSLRAYEQEQKQKAAARAGAEATDEQQPAAATVPDDELLRRAEQYANYSLSGDNAAENAMTSLAYSHLVLARHRGETG